MTDDGATAAMRYKEIIALSRGSADNLRAWELRRAESIEAEIEEASNAIAVATEREERAAERATRWWKMALHNIQGLTWLPRATTPPGPDRPRGLPRAVPRGGQAELPGTGAGGPEPGVASQARGGEAGRAAAAGLAVPAVPARSQTS